MGTQNKQTQLPVFVVEAEHVDVPMFTFLPPGKSTI